MWAWVCKKTQKWADTDEAGEEGVGVGPALGQRAMRLPQPPQIALGKVTDLTRPRLVKHRLLIQGHHKARITSFFGVCLSFDGFETIPGKKIVVNITVVMI